ncbi:hypothetical protein V8G54_013452 [Vigna mungo]|uniref:Leucine-rich repeat-containing N-terminal plant-type domain-containing protein n=1 Tax=Vigna mungo TaxID=3915 RepID=A0AAQ3S4V5_VIGMU
MANDNSSSITNPHEPSKPTCITLNNGSFPALPMTISTTVVPLTLNLAYQTYVDRTVVKGASPHDVQRCRLGVPQLKENTKPLCFILVMMFMFVVSVMLQVAYGQHHIRCLPKEREALLPFKAAIVDHNGMLSSWTTPDCCQWEGIRCTNLTAHIISLHLPGPYYYLDSGRYISGEIHKSLMKLRHLQYFNLSFNDFRDTNIPEFLGSLTNLRYLDLSSSYFS